MPIKKTVSAPDFNEQQPLGPDSLRQRGSSFALTLPAMKEGKSMTFIIKGPADRAELTKALDKGEMSDAWSVSVKDSKTGKSYAINAETLFAYRERRQTEGRESATVKKYVAASPVRKKEAPKPAEERKEVAAVRETTVARESAKPSTDETHGSGVYLAQSSTLKEARQSPGATVQSGRRIGEYISQSGKLHETEQSPGSFAMPGKKKRGEGT